MLKWNAITDHSSYNAQRTTLLTLVEGSLATPYVDVVGVPTIGIGFNLEVDANLKGALQAMIGNRNWNDTLYSTLRTEIHKDYAPGATATLIRNLNRVMADWHDDHNRRVPTTFAFSNDAQIARALDTLAPQYDAIMDRWLAGIPESSERAALFSLTWNAPGLLGPKLKAAIESGDRAEAWYEIRYNSLSSRLPDDIKPAIANRRYVEADMFSLYHNGDRATYAEAVDAGQMLARHHATLLAYEAAYNPLTAASIKGVETIGTISTEQQPAIEAVMRKFGLALDRPVEEFLATSPGMRNLAGDGTAHDGIQNNDDLLLGDKTRNVLSGGDGDDILIGLRGVDRLTGAGGADIFVFTSARDSNASGQGDVITDYDQQDLLAFSSKGFDFHLLAGRNEAFSGTQAEIRWFWSGKNTYIEADYDGNGQADLHIKLLGRHSLSDADFLL